MEILPTNGPLVSIVMCSYNEDKLLEEAIESALNQSYTNFELIISDDASPNPRTKEILLKYEQDPRVRIIFNKKNKGYLKNKNFSIEQAKGDFITQLDNDDLYEKDKIAKQVSIILKKPEIKLVSCGYYRIDLNGNKSIASQTEKDIIIDKPDKEYPFWFPSLLVHKEVYKNAGYFNDYFAGTMGDDIYWTVRVNKKYTIYHLAEPLYCYRYNPHSITNVLNNERKIIVPLVLKILIQQNLDGKEDWLAQKDFEKIDNYEKELKFNKIMMAEQYRIWAAKGIDKKDFKLAYNLLLKSAGKWPFSFKLIKSLFYYIRRRFISAR